MHHKYTEIRIPIEADNPAIQRHEDLCIKCGQCRQVCEREIGVGRLYDLVSTKDTAICIHCGQCANVCPVNSITEVYEYGEVKEAIKDPDQHLSLCTRRSWRNFRHGSGKFCGREDGSGPQSIGSRLCSRYELFGGSDDYGRGIGTCRADYGEKEAAASVYQLLSSMGEVCGNLLSGTSSQHFIGKKPDRHAGTDYQDIFCKEKQH